MSDALSLQTRKAFQLAEEASTGVAARVRLVTVLSCHVLTLFLQTDVVEGPLHFLFLISEDVATETALFGVRVPAEFLTVFTSVIRLCLTSMAEVFITASASDPIPAHVDGSSW